MEILIDSDRYKEPCCVFLASKGPRFLAKAMTMPTEDLVDLISPHLKRAYPNLRDTLLFAQFKSVDPVADMDGSDPGIVWTWTRDTGVAGKFPFKSYWMLEWGYAMWDEKRLKGWKITRSMMRALLGADAETGKQPN